MTCKVEYLCWKFPKPTVTVYRKNNVDPVSVLLVEGWQMMIVNVWKSVNVPAAYFILKSPVAWVVLGRRDIAEMSDWLKPACEDRRIAMPQRYSAFKAEW